MDKAKASNVGLGNYLSFNERSNEAFAGIFAIFVPVRTKTFNTERRPCEDENCWSSSHGIYAPSFLLCFCFFALARWSARIEIARPAKLNSVSLTECDWC